MPEKPQFVELTVTRFFTLNQWQTTDAETHRLDKASIMAELAYSAAVRGLEFDHWPLISQTVTSLYDADDKTHVMLHGRVWAIRK